MRHSDIFDNPGTVIFAGSGWSQATGVFTGPTAQYVGEDAGEAQEFAAEQSQSGHWLTGAISYDFGLKQHGLVPHMRDWRPLIHIYAFPEKQPLPAPSPESRAPGFSRLKMSSQDGYIEKVKQTKAHISAGDVYQLNLATKFTADYSGSNSDLFRGVSRIYPGVHLAYLNLGSRQLISASPELFLEIKDRRIATRPIKGTRPRSQDDIEDAAMRQELQDSPKEQAELNMITDLLRNDLSGVCESGSVRVEESRKLTAHETVWHASSLVSGQLSPEVTSFQALLSCFPGGSITGCPKRRAMELIDELEDEPRGYYAGSVFQLSPAGELESSIAIRTMERDGDKLTLGVGSGIVYDSDPLSEWQETVNKAYLLRSFLID